MKNRKKVFRMFSVTDFKSQEYKLKEMAAEGWILVESKGLYDVYEKSEPEDLDYCISLFQPDLIIDYPDQEKRETYLEFCEDSGWQYVCNNNVYYVYNKPVEADITPIHTDPQEEYKSIKNAFIKGEGIMLLLLLLQFFQLYTNFKYLRYSNILYRGSFFTLFNPIVLILMLSVMLIPSLGFFIRNHKNKKENTPLVYKSYKKALRRQRIQTINLLLYTIYFIAMMSSFGGSRPFRIVLAVIIPLIITSMLTGLYLWKVKKIKHSRKTNLIILIVLFFTMWIGSVTVIFMTVGMGTLDLERDQYDMPEVNIITFEDLGITAQFEPEVRDENEGFLIPLTFEYRSEAEYEEERIFLDVIYVEMRFDIGVSWFVDLVIKNSIEYERDVEFSVDDMIIRNDLVDQAYYLDVNHAQVLLVKDKIVYMITYNGIIDDVTLDKMIRSVYYQ